MKKNVLFAAAAIIGGILMVDCSENVSMTARQEEPAITTACGSSHSQYPGHAPVRQVINADPIGRVTLQGYDPVAFQTVGMAVRGSPYIVSEYLGYKYLFASDENKALFETDPEKYLPAFGGFCTFGVSLGVLFPVDISTWDVINGRLILQFSQEFRQIFEQNTEENLRKADSAWLEIITAKPPRP